MPVEYSNLEQKKTENIEITQELYQKQQEQAWSLVKDFRDTNASIGNVSKKKARFDTMDITQLRDALKNDTKSKSDSFSRMSDKIERLLELSAGGGTETDSQGNIISVSFFDTFYDTKDSVNRYIFDHLGYRFSENGENRLQIALRVKSLLNEMENRLEQQQNTLYAGEARMKKYNGLSDDEIKEQEKLVNANAIAYDVKNFLVLEDKKSGIPKEEENKSIDTWVSKGYSSYLARLLDGKEITSKEDRNDFLAFMESKNNRFVANKIAAAMVLERRKDVTLNMPWVREMLEKRLKDTLTAEELFSKPAELVVRVNEICDRFAADKAKLLATYKSRNEKILKDLEIPEGSADLYRHSSIKGLITNTSPAIFTVGLKTLVGKKKETDDLINEMLKKKFSVATRSTIKRNLYKHLGAMRVYGSTEQVLTQVDMYFEMLAFVSPEEYRVERQLSHLMNKLKVEEVHRDAFLNALTKQHPEEFGKKDNKHWEKDGTVLSGRIQENTKTGQKLMESKKTQSEEKWALLEETSANSITMDSRSYAAAMRTVLGQSIPGNKISLKEYKEKRSFNDAQNQPARKRKIRAEENRIKKLEGSIDKKFYVHLSGTGENTYLACRDLAAAYADNKKKIKERNRQENERFEARKRSVRKALTDMRIDSRQHSAYLERFRWIMSGILDITPDMAPEVRLLNERRNLERFGVKSWDEAVLKIVQLGQNVKPEEAKEVREAKKLYEEGVEALKNCENKRYEELAPFILSIPEVYSALLKGKEAFNDYISTTLNEKLKSFMEGCEKAGKIGSHVNNKTGYYISGAVRKQYAYMFIRDIFEGRLKGDAAFFSDQLNAFQTKLFNVAPEGGISVCDALKKAEKQIEKAGKKDKLRDDVRRLLKLGIMQSLYEKAEDAEGLKLLTNEKEVEKLVKERYRALKADVKEDKDKAAVKANISNPFNWEIIEEPDAVTNVKNEIKSKKLEGIKERQKFLMANEYVLQEVRQCKTLVRVAQKGEKEMTLDRSRMEKMRDIVERYCGDLDLPQVLKDALIERGAEGSVFPAYTNIYGRSSLLFCHALSMKRLYNLLRVNEPGDPGMSEEEVQMYIVKCYGNSALHKTMFNDPEQLKVSDIRKSDDLKAFRAGYKKIVEFEKKEADDPSLQEEIYAISRNLRTMLITGMGVRDEQGKNVEKKDADSLKNLQTIEKAADNSAKYADYWNQVMTVARPEFYDIIKGNKKDFTLPEHYIDRQMAALRQFLMPEVIKELNAGRNFDAEFWKNKLQVFRNDSNYRKYLESDSDSVSKDDFLKKEQASVYDRRTDESAIEKLIGANLYLLKGKLNKYKALDDEQKKLFSVGLMYLNKGALGLGSDGTMALTASEMKNSKDIDRIQREIQNYIEGKEYHFEIDYREAVNKLINYGVTGIGTTEYSMSEEAYEKAMKFAMAVSAKKKAFGEKDLERMEDPQYSVFAAYTKFGKKQQTKIDAYRKKDLTIDDVKSTLLNFALDDKKTSANILAEAGNTVKKRFYVGPLLVFREISVVEKSIARNRRMGRIADRFAKMSDGDMRLLVRILQERTVLDKSLIKKGEGAPLHVDEEKRNALLEALAGDSQISSEVMEGFDNSEACLRALTSALSFKLRDDVSFKGKDLTEDCFEKTSFNRKTIVDWDLIENAFKFFDEVMDKRAAIQASKNSGKLIKFSGNEMAIKAHEQLEKDYANKETFRQQQFETTVKDQANKDNREDIDSALAGYHSLTQQQRILFFKALGSRDILDISKRDYNKNFLGLAERNYVNQTGRDKLIDEYINALRGDNIGLTLEPDEYYKAMEALYTTQISDRVKLSKVKDLTKIFSYERNFIMGRSTAIDWKLFKRALNFVNRASQELEMTEGNALLYRGAGDLEKTGQIKMNYSFLRKNFHRTGNQWARKLIIHGGSAAKQQLDKEDKSGKMLDDIIKGSNIAKYVLKGAGLEDEGYVVNGIQAIKQGTVQARKYKNNELEQAKDADIERYKKTKNTIDNIVKENQTVDEIMFKVRDFVDMTVLKSSDNAEKGASSQKAQSGNLVDKASKNAKLDDKKGDIRDTVSSAYKTVKKVDKIVNKTVPKVEGILEKVTPGKVKDIIELVDYAVEKTVYKIMDEKVFGVNADPNNPDELKALKDAADKYIDEIYASVIGESNLEKMKDVSDKYFNYKKRTLGYVQSAMKHMSFIRNTADGVMNIASCALNIRKLNESREQSKAYKESDKEKLDNAKNRGRLDDSEHAKAGNAASVNSAMADTATSISKAMQGIGIADNVIKMALDTARYAGAGLGLETMAVTKTINAGLEFVNFAVRVLTDRNALKDYFIHTEAGKKELDKIKAGYQAAGNQKLLDKFNRVSDEKTASSSLVDMMSDAKGYEHTEELVENTGMAMAQSIIFSASDYNPMAESKLMAITVMSVMKLENLIGNTSPEAVEKLFNAFKMKR